MNLLFPNAGLSHQQKVEAGAQVFGDTAATIASDILRLLQIQTSILNNISASVKVIETVLTSGRAGAVVQSLQKLNGKRKKQKQKPVTAVERKEVDEEADVVEDDDNDKENENINILSENDDNENHTENIDDKVASLSIHNNISQSYVPLYTSLRASTISSSIFSSSAGSSTASSPSQSSFPSRPAQSMQSEVNKIPEKLKKAAKATAVPNHSATAKKRKTV